MLLNISLNMLVSYIELLGGLVCALTIFRLPIRYQLLKISLITLINTIITTYTFAYLPDLALLINLACSIILMTVIYQLPFFYSLLICIINLFTGGIVEYASTLVATNVLSVPPENITPGQLGARIIYTCSGFILLLIAWALQRKKIGFMFIANQFTMRQSVKGYNFALSAVLIVSVIAIQLASIMFNNLSIHFYILIGLAVLLLAGINIAYRQNKKQLREKHERLQIR